MMSPKYFHYKQGICGEINSANPLKRDYERTFYPSKIFNSDATYY